MGYQADIERLPPTAIIDLQGEASAIAAWCGEALPPFPDRANTASARDGLELYWIGRERWLLRAGIDREEALIELSRPDEAPIDLAIVLVSDTLQFFAITGPDAGEIISIGAPFDHHPSKFPQNGVSFTDLFGVRGLLIRRASGFEIGVERSYADMIADCLDRANA